MRRWERTVGEEEAEVEEQQRDGSDVCCVSQSQRTLTGNS